MMSIEINPAVFVSRNGGSFYLFNRTALVPIRVIVNEEFMGERSTRALVIASTVEYLQAPHKYVFCRGARIEAR